MSKWIPVASLPDTYIISTDNKHYYIRKSPVITRWEVHTIAGRSNGWSVDSLVAELPSRGDAIQAVDDLIRS